MSQLEVSFNSPQCGWMSIGFKDEENEFHTTTACMPYKTALVDLLKILTQIIEGKRGKFVLKWNRNPEEFDFEFTADEKVLLEIYQYPVSTRPPERRELVYSFCGDRIEFCQAFYKTFEQLYEDRHTDEFEFNWRQPFPIREFEHFRQLLQKRQKQQQTQKQRK